MCKRARSKSFTNEPETAGSGVGSLPLVVALNYHVFSCPLRKSIGSVWGVICAQRMRSRRVRKVASSWCQLGPDTATDVVSQGNALRPFAELRPGNAFGVGFQWASGENLRICILLRMRVAKSSRCVYWRTCSARWTWPRPASIYATKDTGIRRYFQDLWNLCSLPHRKEQLRCKGWHEYACTRWPVLWQKRFENDVQGYETGRKEGEICKTYLAWTPANPNTIEQDRISNWC